ncbi:MAG: NAD-dependent epimerase/dehydratase family protein [Ilumatobacter sp.]|uniref:NAD-dependent epimerase/dehydratase family protein n=1 Tax=Ilumatobacter sp. TaxID=1967498 RepID=UPI003918A497
MHHQLERPVVVGAGPVGRAVVARLVASGAVPTVVSRSGTAVAGAVSVAANIAQPEVATEVLREATTVFFVAQPAYHRWTTEYRPLQDSVLRGCERSGAVLIATENLYGYGAGTGGLDSPISETTPLAPSTRKGAVRAEGWHDLAAAHEAGRVRCAAVRASDFFGPGVRESMLGERFFGALAAGKPASVFGPVDRHHSATYVPDLAAAMIRVAERPDALGRAWLAPTAPAVTVAEMIELAAAAAGSPSRHRRLSRPMLRLAGVFVPGARESIEMLYQWEADFTIDTAASQAALDLSPTPLVQSISDTVGWYAAAHGEAKR